MQNVLRFVPDVWVLANASHVCCCGECVRILSFANRYWPVTGLNLVVGSHNDFPKHFVGSEQYGKEFVSCRYPRE
jgi:hypothetical protein